MKASAAMSNAMKEEKKHMLDDEEYDISAAVFAGKRAAAGGHDENDYLDGDADLQGGMYASLKEKYEALLAETKEQDKTVNFQKAKIAALQTELEESLQTQAEQKT